MKTYLLSLILAALAAVPDQLAKNLAVADIASPPVASLEENDDDNTIAFVNGIEPGLVCPMHGPDISGKVALAPSGWWGRGERRHIMIDVTYGCLQGCTWLVRESVSQPEPDSFHRLPPRAQRDQQAHTIGPGACVYSISPTGVAVSSQGGTFTVTVSAAKKN
jgi:hypothetical protein